MSADPYSLPGIEIEFPPEGELGPMSWQVAIKDAKTHEPVNTLTELHLHIDAGASFITATARKLDEDDPSGHDYLVEYVVMKVSCR